MGLALLAASAVGCAPAVTPPEPRPAPLVLPTPILPRVHLAPVNALVTASPFTVGMDSTLPARLDSIIRVGIAEGASPGAAVAVGRYGRLVHLRGYGTLDYAPDSPPVDAATMYDLASLTKVVATTTVAMILEEQARLDIKRPVHLYLPEFDAPDKAPITVEMLLTHSGGLEAYAPLYLTYRGRADYIAQINARPLKSIPGTATVYSDWDMVLLQAVIERITGVPLDQFAAEKVFHPLGMSNTLFNPDTADAALRHRIAATAMDTSRGGLLQGTVHDGNAWALGGVSGHAGLFSSARDLATFAQFLLDGGSYDGVRILAPSTITRWTNRQSFLSSRALGWDTPSATSSAGRYFGARSFGHTGFTGTSIWIDPERGLFVVLLTNRVNSHGTSNRHVQLRRDVADAVQSSILDAPLIDWEVRR
ncbi:MAG: beta-lactamase [Gemmatimonadetes bacterium]|nr:beta-lactamase [Gemmatimonadota bacterium]